MRLLLGFLLCFAAHAQFIPFPGPVNAVASSTCGTPSFSPGAGTYSSTQSVTLTSTGGSGCTVCYNTTGSPSATVPGTCDAGSTTYSTPVSVAVTETLYAIGTQLLYTNSSVGSAAYTINPISYVQGFAKDSNGVSSTADTVSGLTIGSGDLITIYTAFDSANCQNAASGNVANPYQVTDTLNNSFICVVPNSAGIVVTTKMTTVGTGYFSNPTVTVSGCSSPGTVVAAVTGTTPNISVTGLSITTAPSGCGPTLPTIAFSGGTPITGNTAAAAVVAVAIQATQCTALWRAYNVTGGTDAITFGHSGTSYSGFSGLEFSGTTTTDPLDAEADNSTGTASSSITVPGTGTYTTTQTNEVEVIGQSLLNTGVTWTQASGWTAPVASSPGSTGNHYGIISQYKIVSTIQTGVTAPSATANKTAAFNAILGTFQ